MIRLKDVYLEYLTAAGPVAAVGRVSLEVAAGERLVFIGPSGCGKTTMIYLMAGLLAPTAGVIELGGRRVAGPDPRLALILQDYGLLPWKTVSQNAALGLAVRRMGRQEQREIVRPLLAELGLAGLEDRYPAQLSGGQRQRVALARALALRPAYLLMDEPLSALDALTREHLQELLLEVWRERQVTVVMVTHSIEEAVYLGRRLVVLSPRPARVQAVVENPGAGSPGYRASAEFHRQCGRLRELLDPGEQRQAAAR
ncbi:MAG: ABC transporter ATP-binding protein [Clostridia bacterium]|nr:MAG: ABC transporter ATP-binding protein [Clostridia bacterium]